MANSLDSLLEELETNDNGIDSLLEELEELGKSDSNIDSLLADITALEEEISLEEDNGDEEDCGCSKQLDDLLESLNAESEDDSLEEQNIVKLDLKTKKLIAVKRAAVALAVDSKDPLAAKYKKAVDVKNLALDQIVKKYGVKAKQKMMKH